MTFQPSIQQKAVFDWAKNEKGNAFVEAVAGAGKTTTLLELSSQLTGWITIVAYSKKIAQELKNKIADRGMPSTVRAQTFHSFGFSAWMFSHKGCKFDGFKIANIMTEMAIDEGYRTFVSNLVSLAKQSVLGHNNPDDDFLAIVNHHDLYSDLEKGFHSDIGIKLAKQVLGVSNEMARNVIDFDDMIYCPVFFDIRVLQCDWLMVDEAQDTNPARRMMAAKMVKPRTGRIIWVGDRHQAIFGFTGADNNAVNLIVETFKCKQLPLTVTYRCPKSVVAEAQKYVSHIHAHDSAPEGTVTSITQDAFNANYANLTQKDAILCRKTAPLVSLAYTLLRKGIACHVEGKDIGTSLKNLVTKWKKIKSTDAYLVKLEIWERAQVERLILKKKEVAADSIKDRCQTIRVLAEGCETVQCIIDRINKMFGDSDSTDPKEVERCKNLTLSTVHKSKGREWGNVFVLGFNEYMPSPMAKQAWEKEQEINIIYVALTRAQNTLTLVG